IGGAVGGPALDAGAGKPDREAVWMMIATVAALGAGRAAELGPPDDDGLIKQAALLEVLEQAADGPVHLAAQGGVAALEIAVGVPGAGAAVAAVEDLHEADAALHQSASGQALLAESSRHGMIETIEPARGLVLLIEFENLRHGRLHAKCQLIRLDASAQS